jgi:TPR repeat protein
MARWVAVAVLLLGLGAAPPVRAGDNEDCLIDGEALRRDDPARLVAACERLAYQGDAVAQFNLGLMYEMGNGMPRNLARAARWYRKAADQDYGEAEFNLGALYAAGQGVPQDYVQAVKWWRKAADQGNSAAQSNLGVVYASGTGVSKDYAEAAKWWRKAANQRDPDAQYNLGIMYARGDGLAKDYVQAYVWLSLAAARGHRAAANARDVVAGSMTPVQLAEMQRLVHEWKPQREP